MTASNPVPARRRTRRVKTPAPILRRIAPLLLLVALTGCGGDPGAPEDSTSPGPGGATVTTKLLTYEPEELTVPAGTTVTWKAGDGVGHTVTTGTFTVGGDGLRTEENPDGQVDQPLSRGKDVTFTFDEPGTYTYFCSIHKGMSGEVVVTP